MVRVNNKVLSSLLITALLLLVILEGAESIEWRAMLFRYYGNKDENVDDYN